MSPRQRNSSNFIVAGVFTLVLIFFVRELWQNDEIIVDTRSDEYEALTVSRASFQQLQAKVRSLERDLESMHGQITKAVTELKSVSSTTPNSNGIRSGGRDLQEVWARGSPLANEAQESVILSVNEKLSDIEKKDLKALCARCLFGTLFKAVDMTAGGRFAYVQTGDINLMWTRDSAVQIAIYMSRMTRFPAIRLVVEGVIRKMAFNIVHDPYANAYSKAWFDPRPGQSDRISKRYRVIGRGGWTGTRNYELDSGGYFMSMVWNYFNTPGLQSPEWLISEPVVFEAVNRMVDVWIVEQHHENSPYRYSELENEGKGPHCGHTGMTWTGFTPADDKVQYGYHIPSNMYAVAGIDRMLDINAMVWKNDAFTSKARKLRDEIRSGIEKHGVLDLGDGTKVYAYEVNGLGNSRHDFDDANVPSLLSIPLLGYKYYDKEIYETTRRRLLSHTNAYYFEGSFLKGLGSPHTPHGNVWSMALCIQGLTTSNVEERCGNGLMHESVNVNNVNQCSRTWFEWANALYVVYVENAMGIDCTDEAEELRKNEILQAETSSFAPGVGIVATHDDPLFYHTLENQIRYSPDGGSQRGWFET